MYTMLDIRKKQRILQQRAGLSIVNKPKTCNLECLCLGK